MIAAPAFAASLMAGALLAALPAAAAEKFRLTPLKDDTFTAPSVLETQFGGDLVKVAYIPVAKGDDAARPAVADPAPVQELTYSSGGAVLKYAAAGETSDAKIIVVYVHGWGANRSQGTDDGLFGGNLVRLRTLIARSGGVYLSADFSGFGSKGAADLTTLIRQYTANAPGAKVFLVCISFGGKLCWRLAENAETAMLLGGVLILGAPVDSGFLDDAPAAERVPIYLGQGTKDSFANWKSHVAFFTKVKEAIPDYPIRLTLFDEGEHATAIRLTDWHTVINWMLAADDGPANAAAAAPSGATPPCPRLDPRTNPAKRAVC